MKITILHNKSGVTVLEGVIALGLLALIMAGSFGVLLSSSRTTSQPDMKEEMLLAVESAHHMLKSYAAYSVNNLETKMGPYQPTNLREIDYSKGLCGNDEQPMTWGSNHDIKCLLPLICAYANSSFTYKINASDDLNWPFWIRSQHPTDPSRPGKWEGTGNPQMYWDVDNESNNRDKDEYGPQDTGSWDPMDTPWFKIEFKIVCNGYEL